MSVVTLSFNFNSHIIHYICFITSVVTLSFNFNSHVMHYLCLLTSFETSFNFFQVYFCIFSSGPITCPSLNVSTAHACSSITQSTLGSKSIVLSVLQEKKGRKYMKATDILSLLSLSSFKESGQRIQLKYCTKLQLSVLSEISKKSEKLLIGSHQYHFLLMTPCLSIRASGSRSVSKSIRFGCK